MTPDTLLSILPSPDPLPLAAPPLLLHGLLLLTSVLHLLAMNLLVGGTGLALAARMFGQRNRDAAQLELSRTILKALPTCIAITVTLGVAPLLFLQVLFGRVFYVSSILMGWWWLAVVPVLIAVYYGAYALAAGRGGTRVVTLVFTGLLFISLMLSTNMTLMLAPASFAERYAADPAGLRPDFVSLANLPRWLHFILGGIAVASLGLAIWGAANRRREPALRAVAARMGMAGFTRATAVNVAVGLFWLGTLPQERIRAFVGGDAVATTGLALGILLGIWALWLALGVPRREIPQLQRLGRLAAVVLATVILMVLTRDQLRTGMLGPFGVTPTAVGPQWSVIGLFAACLVLALGVIFWMVRAYAGSPAESRQGTPAGV